MSAMVEPSVHGGDCSCTRCLGFQAGNVAAVKHGSYGRLRQQQRAEQLRSEIEPLVPFRTVADGPIIDLLSFTLAQVERAGLVLAVEQAQVAKAHAAGQPPPERLDRLAADARSWVRTAARLLDQLAMTPLSRARLAGDLAVAERTLTAQALRAEYGDAS